MCDRRQAALIVAMALMGGLLGCRADRPPVQRVEPLPPVAYEPPVPPQPPAPPPTPASVENYARGLAADLARSLAQAPAIRDAKFRQVLLVGPATVEPGTEGLGADRLGPLLAEHLANDSKLSQAARIGYVDNFPAKPDAPPPDPKFLRSPGGEDPPPQAQPPVDPIYVHLRVSPGRPNTVDVRVLRGKGNETVLARKYLW